MDLEIVQEWQTEETHYFEGDQGNGNDHFWLIVYSLIYIYICSLSIHVEEASWTSKYVIYLDLYNSLHDAWKACKDSKQLTIKYNQMKK